MRFDMLLMDKHSILSNYRTCNKIFFIQKCKHHRLKFKFKMVTVRVKVRVVVKVGVYKGSQIALTLSQGRSLSGIFPDLQRNN